LIPVTAGFELQNHHTASTVPFFISTASLAIPPRRTLVAAILALSLLMVPGQADAYIGPGAGFVFLSSFLLLLSGIVLAVLSILAWPFRTVWRTLHRRRSPSLAKRLIIVGFDGQDPALTDRFIRQGLLPNFARLAELGCYSRLKTTFPSVSPVAWSSFSTGTQPGKHSIFDFLDRDRRTYLPLLSSVRMTRAERFFRVGPFQIPREKPGIALLRRSRPFWSILGEYGIWSTVLRVPVTFPPDRFHGAELSAMCVPDLLGSQGTFLLFTTRAADTDFDEGGVRVAIHLKNDRAQTAIKGPDNLFRVGTPPLEILLAIHLDRSQNRARLEFGDTIVSLDTGCLSDWIKLKFRAAPGVNVYGMSRWMVTEMADHFSLYMSPISIDPEHPAMPVSHPVYYSSYLAKRIGPFSTLGLAEDTWALNEGVIDEKTFLQQTYDIDAERQAMFSVALDTLREGVLACVFDATDRVQHMFWRYLEADGTGGHATSPHCDAIADLYQSNDRFVGSLLDRLGPDDVLMVISDHGFSSFRRGINLNSWLMAEGYLKLKPGADGASEWLRDVDWTATRAYAMGLTGLFLNLKGRESEGIVASGAEADALKDEIVQKLAGLRDPDNDTIAIVDVFQATRIYSGPYVEAAPDLLLGYNAGYRASWDGAKGIVRGPVFTTNTKAWSGDHCIDPRLVPGVLFSNRKISVSQPALIDIAPTALHLFGVPTQRHMDGQNLFAQS
jgi:predicted AlkP superfamily phosphohydrolase/phosphomutase